MAPSFQLSNNTQSSINASSPFPLLSLQDAMDVNYRIPLHDFQSPSLFPNACTQSNGSTTSTNCTAVCSNAPEMFASLDTLHNCVVWPAVYAENALGNLTSDAAELAGSLGLVPSNDISWLPSNISAQIQDCMLDSCDNDEDCARSANRAFHPGGFREHFSVNVTGSSYYGSGNLPPYFNPCQFTNAPATADVAGIGVFISYAMQMGLILIFFIFAIPWKRCIHGARDILSATSSALRRSKQGKTSLSSHAAKKNAFQRTRMLTSALGSALAPAMVEFQKAQCFFMLATNIAGLVVQKEGGLDPDSVQSLYNDYIFIKVIAIGGYLPITFGLLILRMLGSMDWLLLILSIVSVGVAIGDLKTKREFKPDENDLSDILDTSLQGGPSSCGNNNPVAWCYNWMGVNSYGFRQTNDGSGGNDILAFSLVTLVLLVIDHFWNSKDATNRRSETSFSGKRRNGTIES